MINRFSVAESWPTVPLDQAVEFLDHRRKPVKESQRVSGAFGYYGANGRLGSIDGYLFDEPTILLAEDGGHFGHSTKRIAYRVSGKYWVNNHAHVLKPRPEIDFDFLCRVLENYDVTPFVSGSTRAKLNKAQAAKIPIPLPPLPEQRRIAAILDKADALRQKRRAAIAKLDQLLQSVFLEMFGDPVTNAKGWETSKLNSVCERIVDCPHSTPKWADDGLICLRTSNVGKGRWLWDDTRYITHADFEKRTKRSKIIENDIVLSREGTVGIAALVTEDMEVCLGQRLVQVRPDSARIAPSYLLDFLLHVLSPERIGRLMVGSTSKHLNVGELRELRIITPPIEFQRVYSKRVRRIADLRRKHCMAEGASSRLFASLQTKAFTGRL